MMRDDLIAAGLIVPDPLPIRMRFMRIGLPLDEQGRRVAAHRLRMADPDFKASVRKAQRRRARREKRLKHRSDSRIAA